jgi:hypothetical protein
VLRVNLVIDFGISLGRAIGKSNLTKEIRYHAMCVPHTTSTHSKDDLYENVL